MGDTVSLLANLATKYKLVPFLGAGCSKDLLGVDWDSIRDGMAEELNIQSDDHLKVAQVYVNQFGRDGLCRFLSQRLLIDTFDVEKGTADIKIMSLGLGLIYTTNQDNVLEKCFQEFGRDYKVITTIDDLAESNPRDWLLIKYHGHLSAPESVVFTADDYQLRIEQQDHFLNIRLRADALARNLLFIGYGMRDKNVLGLLEGLQRAFYGKLPQSYLIAFQSNDEFEKECAGYGVQVIDPRKEYPGIVDAKEAFDRFLSELAEQTIRKRYENEESMFFNPKLPRARKVLTLSELSIVEQVVNDGSANQAIRTFRNTIDRAVIPKAFEERVVNCFVTMSRSCSNSDEASQISGAAFNIHLNEMVNRLIVQACVLTTINLDSKGRGGVPRFLPHTPNFRKRQIQDTLN